MVVDGCFWTVQAEDFQEHILGGVILVYNCYSEQSVCNLTKRRTLPPRNFQKWMAFYIFLCYEKCWLYSPDCNFFKNTFFPSAIIEWNKLDLAIRNAESLGIFKSNILKFFRPTPRSFFNCYNHKEIRRLNIFSTVHY